MNSARKNSKKPYIYIFSIALFFLAVSESYAYCTAQGGRTVPLRPAIYWVSNGPWTIDAELPVGSRLLELETYAVHAYNPDLIICSAAVGQYVDRHSGIPLGNATYSTNIAGIGMWYPPLQSYYSSTSIWYYNHIRGKVVFVKTGPITATGNVTLTGLGYSFIAPDHGSVAMTTGNFPNVPLYINPRRTCGLSNRSPSVNFGQVPIRTTNGLLAEATFNVSVQCSGGTSGTTPVRITFSDANNTSNYTRDLSIVPASSGMTVNLFYRAMAITLGPASASANNPGQILLGDMGNGLQQFPITTRLMRVGPMSGLPSFNARSTITMRYE